MKEINLPLCNSIADIGSALQVMDKAKCGAVAIFRGQDFRIVTAGQLVVAHHRGSEAIAEVAAQSLAAGRPVNLWLGSDAAQTYRTRLAGRELNVFAPSPMGVAQINEHVESHLFGSSGMMRINWQFSGPNTLPASLRPRAGAFDDLVTGRFDHPWLDVWVGDELANVLSLAPRDYYCDGSPQHDYDEAVPGGVCKLHIPPAQIIRR